MHIVQNLQAQGYPCLYDSASNSALQYVDQDT